MSITIYHNPACGTSRNTLAMIRQSGEEPQIIEYLKTPPTRERLQDLIVAMGVPVRALLREKGTPYHELGLADPKWSDDELIDFMLAHPILINRPIVVTPKGIKLCRPSEAVRDILPNPTIVSPTRGVADGWHRRCSAGPGRSGGRSGKADDRIIAQRGDGCPASCSGSAARPIHRSVRAGSPPPAG